MCNIRSFQQCCHETLVLHAPTSQLSFPFPHFFELSFSTCWLSCALFLTFCCIFNLHATIYWSNSLLKPWIWSNQNPRFSRATCSSWITTTYFDSSIFYHCDSLSWRTWTPQETSSFYKERQFGDSTTEGRRWDLSFLQKIQSFCWRN